MEGKIVKKLYQSERGNEEKIYIKTRGEQWRIKL